MTDKGGNNEAGVIERWTVFVFILFGYLIALPLVPYIVNVALSDTVPSIVRWIPVTMSIVLIHILFTVYSKQYSPIFYRVNVFILKSLGRLTALVVKNLPKATLWVGRFISKLTTAGHRLSNRVVSKLNNR